MKPFDVSAPLRNPKWELYAQGLSQGRTVLGAFGAAGFSALGKSAAANAYRLKNKVQGRVEYLLRRRIEVDNRATARVIQRLAIEKEDVASEMKALAMSNMLDYLDPETLQFDFTKLTRDQAAAIREVTIDSYVEGRGKDAQTIRRVRLKLHDKPRALMDLAKLFGWIVERREDVHRIEEQLAAMKPEERAADARTVLAQVRQRLLEYREAMATDAEVVDAAQPEGEGPAIDGTAVVIDDQPPQNGIGGD